MDVEAFQRRLLQDYNHEIGLPQPYEFIDGNPVEPVVPREVATDGVFILGAYPTARFARRAGEAHVPVGNVERPFDSSTNSGKELDEHYLKQMDIDRSQCWITNLVRTFLFKQGHVDKYERLGCTKLPPETRKKFKKFASSDINLHWLQRELDLARPRVLITLGAEVAGVLHKITARAARDQRLDGQLHEVMIGDHSYQCFHLAHPGIVMRRGSERNPWPERHKDHCAIVKTVLRTCFEIDTRN